MKKVIYYLFFVTIALSSCNLENRKPEFKRIENLKVNNLSTTITEIEADAVVYNPNGVSIYLNKTAIDVYANDIKVSKITQTKKTEVSKKSEFKIPLKANLNLMDLIKDESSVINILNSTISGFKDKKIDLIFEGTATFEVAGVSFDVPIEYEEVVNLKK